MACHKPYVVYGGTDGTRTRFPRIEERAGFIEEMRNGQQVQRKTSFSQVRTSTHKNTQFITLWATGGQRLRGVMD